VPALVFTERRLFSVTCVSTKIDADKGRAGAGKASGVPEQRCVGRGGKYRLSAISPVEGKRI